MLRLFTVLLTLVLLAVVSMPFVAIMLVLSNEPLVVYEGELDYRDLGRAQRLLEQNDPRRLRPGSTQTLSLPQEDINLLLRYGLGRVGESAAALRLGPDRAALHLALQLPDNPVGRWLNVHAQLYPSGSQLRLDKLELGKLQVPKPVANALLQLGDRLLRRDALYSAGVDSLRELQFGDQLMTVTYQWQPELVDRVRTRGSEFLISASERERLLVYTERIAALAQDPALGYEASMDRLVGPLFSLAATRSDSGDAAAENRSLLAALAIYVNGVDLARLVNVPADSRYRPRQLIVTLQGRQDLAQHFSISAAVAATGGVLLADALGLSKELQDSNRGSGFSFTDLAADRAGVRFAQVATGDDARRLQQLLAGGTQESDYIPIVTGLPEFMRAQQFRRRYGSVDSAEYKRVAEDIEHRISALPVHRLQVL